MADLTASQEKRNGLSTLGLFIRTYSVETCLVILVLFLSGFAEFLGIGTMLPLVSVIFETTGANNTPLSNIVNGIFNAIGLTPTLPSLLLIIVTAITLKAIIVFLAMTYASNISAKISLLYRNRLITALMNARWAYFAKLPVGHISNALSEEAIRAGNCYMLGCKAMGSLIMIMMYIGSCFLVAWKVSIFAMVLGVTLGYFLKGITKMARDAGYKMTAAMKDLLARMGEMLTGVKALKSMAKEEPFLNHIFKTTDIVYGAQKKQFKSTHLLNVIYEPILVIFLAIGLYVTIAQMQMPVASVMLLAFLFYRMMGQAHQFQNFYQNMVLAESAVWSLEDQIHAAENAREEIDTGGEKPSLKSAINIKSISFTHDYARPLFKDFSATIPANAITVVFGPSGSGKSTLLDMILGFHKPQSGEIQIDSKNLNTLNMREWRKDIGYVPQETFLFHDTIANNVSLGTQSEDQQIIKALTKSGAINFVNEKPDGINFTVGERGGMLSGGQRQRIAIARALYHNPEILILDEATSGLDTETEKAIFETLTQLKKEVTILVISHNPAALNYADHTIHLGSPQKAAA